MTARAAAPGKVILFGEHAVVYGRPALAVPVTQVQATAEVQPADSGFWLELVDIGRRYALADAAPDDALARAVRLTLDQLRQPPPRAVLRLQSTIPIAAGLGSGAAVSTAAVRALARFLGVELPPAQVSGIVFECEKLLHGTPSGIDNTVIAFGQPVWFVRGQAPVPLRAAQPFQLLIGDTGRPSPTKIAVGEVRAAWEREPARFEALFDTAGDIARRARQNIEAGDPAALGPLMRENHACLQVLGVSSPELDELVAAAQAAGALGAKLSGAGRGGNMIALVTPETQAPVREALMRVGAVRVLKTIIGNGPEAYLRHL